MPADTQLWINHAVCPCVCVCVCLCVCVCVCAPSPRHTTLSNRQRFFCVSLAHVEENTCYVIFFFFVGTNDCHVIPLKNIQWFHAYQCRDVAVPHLRNIRWPLINVEIKSGTAAAGFAASVPVTLKPLPPPPDI